MSGKKADLLKRVEDALTKTSHQNIKVRRVVRE